MQMNSYPMMNARGGLYGRFPMRGMMRRPWRQFPAGAERDFFYSPFEMGPLACRGQARWKKGRAQRRKENKDQKKNSGEEKENDIVIDPSSDENPEPEGENPETDAFEVQVNMRGCDPDQIKISVKDGLLKIEGRSKSADTNFVSVKYEQTIPEDVSTDNMKAFLYPEGLLTISEMEESVFPLQLKVEK